MKSSQSVKTFIPCLRHWRNFVFMKQFVNNPLVWLNIYSIADLTGILCWELKEFLKYLLIKPVFTNLCNTFIAFGELYQDIIK